MAGRNGGPVRLRRSGSGTGARWPLARRLGIWLGIPALVLCGLIFVAVVIEAQQLPGFGDMKSSQSGQTIVVRARDGMELVSLGPSYGRWLSYG